MSYRTSFSISPEDLYPAFPSIPESATSVPKEARGHAHRHMQYSPSPRPQVDLTYIDAAYVEHSVEIVKPDKPPTKALAAALQPSSSKMRILNGSILGWRLLGRMVSLVIDLSQIMRWSVVG